MASLTRRASGILLHLTSLPGPFGSGDLGPAAHRFADFLHASRQTWWQVLPVSPVGPGDSPYASPCVFAGNPCLVSLESLVAEGLLTQADLRAPRARDASRSTGRADFDASLAFREPRLRRAFAALSSQRRHRYHRAMATFRDQNRAWFEDYALYAAIKRREGGKPWWQFPDELRQRRPAALASARRSLAGEIDFTCFVQLAFADQLGRLREACRARGVSLMGDAPMFVADDSVELWAHPELFLLDRRGEWAFVAGAPPDAFSRDGQLWGNPLYRWDAMARDNYSFWQDRLRADFARFDALRLDHFIGFTRFWAIPRSAKTARGGRWRKGPGPDFFTKVLRDLGPLALVAEDLGATTPEVFALRDRFELPGMRVLQFAFDPAPTAEPDRPHWIPRRSVVYTGTHDNDTVVGWFTSPPKGPTKSVRDNVRREREIVKRYLATDGRDIHEDMLRLAWMSPADTAIAPIQDILGLGTEARMNRPGTAKGNWSFRLTGSELDRRLASRLAELTTLYGRAP